MVILLNGKNLTTFSIVDFPLLFLLPIKISVECVFCGFHIKQKRIVCAEGAKTVCIMDLIKKKKL